MTFHPRRAPRKRGKVTRELNSACRDVGRGWRTQRIDEWRGGIEHLSGLGHIWLKYMSPVWGVIFIRQPDKRKPHGQRYSVIQQDSITSACPLLPSQSLLINAEIDTERMLCSNFSFYTPRLFNPAQSPLCLLLSYRPREVSEEDVSKNGSPKLRIIPSIESSSWCHCYHSV